MGGVVRGKDSLWTCENKLLWNILLHKVQYTWQEGVIEDLKSNTKKTPWLSGITHTEKVVDGNRGALLQALSDNYIDPTFLCGTVHAKKGKQNCYYIYNIQ